MMKIKFNKFERVAGLFVLSFFAGLVFIAISVAYKRGWFDSKVNFSATFDSADGIHPGTSVQMAGLRAGNVDDVELLANNKIKVSFHVLEKFHNRIREDSTVSLIRPFIIGDRVLDVEVGAEDSQRLLAGAEILTKETMDIMSLMSGKNLGPYLESMSGLASNLKVLLDAFSDEKRTGSLISTFDQIDPLVKNLNMMSVEVIKLAKQATKNENLGQVLGNLSTTTHELNAMIPEIQKASPNLAADIGKLVTNFSALSGSLKAMGPAIDAIGPDLPQTSVRAVEALNEAVVLLKAMQKSFFMRGSVVEVREEEQKRQERKPANVEKAD
ncbi:MAG: MlaD family protein [Pseudobdellovibrionaceae bacterium]